MSEAEPKVVNLFTREEVVAEGVGIDAMSVEALYKALERAERGDLHGVTIVAWSKEGGDFAIWAVPPDDEKLVPSSYRYIGILPALQDIYVSWGDEGDVYRDAVGFTVDDEDDGEEETKV